MVSVRGRAIFSVETNQEDEEGNLIYRKVIVPAEDIEWQDPYSEEREMGAETCYAGEFHVDDVGTATIELYEYPEGVLNYTRENVPDGCEVMKWFEYVS